MGESLGRPAKKERNKQVLEMRKKGYAFRKIAEFFNLDVKTAYDIYVREVRKRQKK